MSEQSTELSPAAKAYLAKLAQETPEQLEHEKPVTIPVYWDDDDELDDRTDSWLRAYEDQDEDDDPVQTGTVGRWFQKRKYKGRHRLG